MKKIVFVFIILLTISIQAFSAAVTTHYNNWKIRRITYNNTDTKTVTMTIKNNNSLEVWYKDKVDENTPVVEYSFNNSPYKSVEPFMRSSSDNFDILYTISPAFGIIQEKEVIEFLSKLINSKTLSIKPNSGSQAYTIDVTGLKEAMQKTDFSGTLLEKYKSQILK